MALKDWKKTTLGWTNKNKNADVDVIRLRSTKQWSRVVWINDNRISDTIFKTKSRAVASARSYMRSH